MLLARASNWYCEVHGPVELLLANQEGVVAVGSLPAVERWKHELVARPGGAWLVEAQVSGVSATPLDALGVPAGPAWVGAPRPGGGHIDVKPWRDGFAIAEFANIDGVHGARLRVSDGFNVTELAPITDDGTSSRTLGVAVSADGSSLVVAHEVQQQLVVQRADCTSVAP